MKGNNQPFFSRRLVALHLLLFIIRRNLAPVFSVLHNITVGSVHKIIQITNFDVVVGERLTIQISVYTDCTWEIYKHLRNQIAHKTSRIFLLVFHFVSILVKAGSASADSPYRYITIIVFRAFLVLITVLF